MKIQVLKPKFRVDETLNEIKICLEQGWTGMGFKTIEFENAWKTYSGFNNAHFLNSATSGLHLAINIYKNYFSWAEDDEIISTPMTFVSTNHAVLYERMKLVFADVDESLNINPQELIKQITPKTKAVIFVAIGGNMANYDAVLNICKEYNLIFIFDGAHSAGTKSVLDKKHAGLDSDVAIFSFQAVKNLPSADSGMICFSDEIFDNLARKQSWLGIDKDTFKRFNKGSYLWDYNVSGLGFKYHGNSIIASICIVALKYLDSDNEYRRNLAKLYRDLLNGVPQIKPISHTDSYLSSRHIFQVVAEDRNRLIDYLAENEIYCGVHYKSNSIYDLYIDTPGSTLYAENISNNILSLPLHLNIGDEDVMRIVDLIKEFYIK